MELLPFHEWEDQEDDCLVLSDEEEMDDADEIGTNLGRSLSVHRSQRGHFDKESERSCGVGGRAGQASVRVQCGVWKGVGVSVRWVCDLKRLRYAPCADDAAEQTHSVLCRVFQLRWGRTGV